MKKLLSMALALLLILSACGTTSTDGGPVYKVKDGAFSCTVQELIDSINELTKDSDVFPQIGARAENADNTEIASPDLTTSLEDTDESSKIEAWTENTDDIEIDIKIAGPDLTMTLREENGKLHSVDVYWKAENSNSVIWTESEILTSALFKLLVPNPDLVQENISKVKTEGLRGGGSWSGGVDVNYNTIDESGVNYLRIEVREGPGQF